MNFAEWFYLSEARLLTKSRKLLIPYGDWSEEEAGELSKFKRDVPALNVYAKKNPEALASLLIFSVMSIQANFADLLTSFPLVMGKLFSKFSHHNSRNPLHPNEYKDELYNMQSKVHSMINTEDLPKTKRLAKLQKNSIATMATVFSWKKKAIANIWSKRRSYFSKIRPLIDDLKTVQLFEYLAKEIPGLGVTKSGFSVQLIMGKLGCIDTHNLWLYRAYARQDEKPRLFKMLNPKKLTKSADSVKTYIRVLDLLAANEIDTVALWDNWVNYVSHNYGTYDETGPYAGYSVAPGSKLSTLGKIGPHDWQWGRSKGAGSVSRGHRIIGNIRNIKWWHDILDAAETPQERAPEVKVRKHVDYPHKALTYLVADPDFAKALGLDDEFIRRAHNVLGERGIFKREKSFI